MQWNNICVRVPFYIYLDILVAILMRQNYFIMYLLDLEVEIVIFGDMICLCNEKSNMKINVGWRGHKMFYYVVGRWGRG